MTHFSDWLHSSLGSLFASINRYRHHSLCLTYVFLPKFAARSPYLWSSPILSGCSGSCLQYMLQFAISPPQGSFTGRSSGDCFTTFLLWHPLFITSDRGSLAWGGAGTPVPCMMAAHTQGCTNPWSNKNLVSVEDSWQSVLVHHFVRGDVSHDLMHCLPSLFFPPILIFLFPFQASAFSSTKH